MNLSGILKLLTKSSYITVLKPLKTTIFCIIKNYLIETTNDFQLISLKSLSDAEITYTALYNHNFRGKDM